MQQFIDYLGTYQGGRRFITLEEERALLQTATGSYGLALADAQSALLVGARQFNLILESEIAEEVTDFLTARLRQGNRVGQADFRAAAAFFSGRTGTVVPPAEAEQRVRQLVIRAGWSPAPSGWLWRNTAWFDRIPDPVPRATPVSGPIVEPVSDPVPMFGGGAPGTAGGDPGAVLETWAAALRSRSVPRIIALYTPDALLLATAEERPLIGPTQISTYFERLMSYEALDVTFQEELQRLTTGRATLISGLYTFSWIDPTTNAAVVTPARYTYAVRNTAPGVRARISLHHSSSLPGGAGV